VPPDELTDPATPEGRGPVDRPLLDRGAIEILGRMPWSSNGTYLVELSHGDDSDRAIYKPHRGERPLWDFPDGLYRREVASWELSDHLGWHLVPRTVVRDDAPHGTGSLQAFVDTDLQQHYFTLLADEALHPQFRRLAAFDIVTNNTDRKSGHCLLGTDGSIWAIDNGLSFHAQFKLRTVIWEFAGHPLDDDVLADLEALTDDGLPDRVACLLGVFERDAVLTRARALLRAGCLPADPSGQRYPWPLV
jgi:uncharacterized repeat protein (TIGR03843 family)